MDRQALKTQLQKDGIHYLLVQFVDMHGCAKVKMVPADCLDDVADAGAGFAGGAVWGMGQNASSHDMMARIDLCTYTPLPTKPGVARFAADLYVDGKPRFDGVRDFLRSRGIQLPEGDPDDGAAVAGLDVGLDPDNKPSCRSNVRLGRDWTF